MVYNVNESSQVKGRQLNFGGSEPQVVYIPAMHANQCDEFCSSEGKKKSHTGLWATLAALVGGGTVLYATHGKESGKFLKETWDGAIAYLRNLGKEAGEAREAKALNEEAVARGIRPARRGEDPAKVAERLNQSDDEIYANAQTLGIDTRGKKVEQIQADVVARTSKEIERAQNLGIEVKPGEKLETVLSNIEAKKAELVTKAKGYGLKIDEKSTPEAILEQIANHEKGQRDIAKKLGIELSENEPIGNVISAVQKETEKVLKEAAEHKIQTTTKVNGKEVQRPIEEIKADVEAAKKAKTAPNTGLESTVQSKKAAANTLYERVVKHFKKALNEAIQKVKKAGISDIDSNVTLQEVNARLETIKSIKGNDHPHVKALEELKQVLEQKAAMERDFKYATEAAKGANVSNEGQVEHLDDFITKAKELVGPEPEKTFVWYNPLTWFGSKKA